MTLITSFKKGTDAAAAAAPPSHNARAYTEHLGAVVSRGRARRAAQNKNVAKYQRRSRFGQNNTADHFSLQNIMISKCIFLS